MQKKSDANEGLYLLAAQESIPAEIVGDNAREQTMENFRKMEREMGCHIKHTEAYSPWQNVAEGNTREFKQGAGRKMMSSKGRTIWDSDHIPPSTSLNCRVKFQKQSCQGKQGTSCPL